VKAAQHELASRVPGLKRGLIPLSSRAEMGQSTWRFFTLAHSG
jgi:hypothetical protein